MNCNLIFFLKQSCQMQLVHLLTTKMLCIASKQAPASINGEEPVHFLRQSYIYVTYSRNRQGREFHVWYKGAFRLLMVSADYNFQ